MKTITFEHYNKMLDLCKKGKHKFRENKFGVVFCVKCGLLSTAVGSFKPLDEDDKLNIIK